MANTYTQLYIHCIFAPKFRAALLSPAFDERLRRYITALVQKRGHKILAINNTTDHVHVLIGLNPAESLASLMAEIKAETSRWINEEKLTPVKFRWQEGYGAFSYSRSQIDKVARYIANQDEHHRKETFLDEYRRILKDFEVAYNELYIFKNPD